MTAAQQWTAQQQQQLPALPAPVYPPGMQPTNVQPPPGLAATNAPTTWQGVSTQSTPMTFQFGSSANRQQSPFGSQPQQDRQRTDSSRHLVHNRNSLREIAHGASSSHSIHFTEGECCVTRKRAFMKLLVLEQFTNEWTGNQYMKGIPGQPWDWKL